MTRESMLAVGVRVQIVSKPNIYIQTHTHTHSNAAQEKPDHITPKQPERPEPSPPPLTKPPSQMSKRAGSVRSDGADSRKSPQKLSVKRRSSTKAVSPAPPAFVHKEEPVM